MQVDEVSREQLVPLREETARAQPWATSEEVVREVVAAGEIAARAGNSRFFAVQVDGRPVAAAQLNSDGRIAEVDDVATLPEFRRRGYASAVVLRAVEEALASGHDLVFLVAEDEDWPKELYARLGFEADRSHLELAAHARARRQGLAKLAERLPERLARLQHAGKEVAVALHARRARPPS